MLDNFKNYLKKNIVFKVEYYNNADRRFVCFVSCYLV